MNLMSDNMKTTKEQMAALLHGREIGNEITKDEERLAKESGLLVVFGASDDLMELRGAVHDEAGCYDGGDALVSDGGVLMKWETLLDSQHSQIEVRDWFAQKDDSFVIEALWDQGGVAWSYKTSIPHATFDVMEDGAVYCRGIVIDMEDQ